MRVTQNARLRVFDTANNVIWFRDRSCAGSGSCETHDAVRIHGTQRASVQCNGVREHVAGAAYNTCSILVTYEH